MALSAKLHTFAESTKLFLAHKEKTSIFVNESSINVERRMLSYKKLAVFFFLSKIFAIFAPDSDN